MKALFIGLGGVGQRHLRNLIEVTGGQVQLLAWRTRRLQQVVTDDLQVLPDQDLESRYGIAAFTDLDQALAQKPDVTFIANPSSLHVEPAQKALLAGSHVFIEKPLSHNLDGIDALVDLAKSQGKVGYVGFQLRYNPAINALKVMLDQGKLGRVLGVRAVVAEYMPGFHKYEDYRTIYAARRELGGGVILSQIHELDYLQWLFGAPTSLSAVGGHLSDLEIDVEDTAMVQMRCPQADGRVIPVSVYMDFLQQPPMRTCTVFGTAGRIEMDLRALTVTRLANDGTVAEFLEWPGFVRNTQFLDQTRHFLAACRGEVAPLVDLAEGRTSLRMAVAALRSVQANGAVVEMQP